MSETMESAGLLGAGPFAVPDVVVERGAGGIVRYRSRTPLAEPPERVTDRLVDWARRKPQAPFLKARAGGSWRGIGWAEAEAATRAIGANLLARGMGAERGIAVLSGNDIEHALVGLGAMRAGIPWASISPPYSLASEDLAKLRSILGLYRPGAIYVDRASRFARALAVPEAAGITVFAREPDGVPGVLPLDHLLSEPPRASHAQLDRACADAVVKVLFTSGSTGQPKGVRTTHRMMAANQEQIAAAWPFLADAPPVLLDWLPWSHVFGGSHNLNMVIRNGGTMWIDDGRPLPSEIGRTLRNLSDVSPTISFNVPKGYELLLPHLEDEPAIRGAFLAELRLVFYAGAALAPPLWRRLESVLAKARRPVHLVSSWGLTETAPAVLLVHRAGAAPGSIGTPLPGTEVKLVPDGDKLEVRVRGPNVTPGYLGNDESTRAAFDEEGYFRTGDAMAWIDHTDPSLGLRFDGRLTEDFKLATGTRVNAAVLKAQALTALAKVARDLIVVGADRDDIGILLVPHDHRRGELDSDALRAEVATALRDVNASGNGASSRSIARAAFLREPLSLDAGEITDKGSINIRAVLARRPGVLARLYDPADPEAITP